MQDISTEILVKAAEGDLAAFELVYKAAARFVYNVAYRVVNDREDAEELTQEVFLTIFRKLQTFRFQSSFKTWVYRITMNCALNHLKKISPERHAQVEYDENLLPEGSPVRAESSKESQEEILSAYLRSLNPDQKACVVLRNIEGLSYQEIAETLRININTVRSRLKRARETMLRQRKEVVKDEM